MHGSSAVICCCLSVDGAAERWTTDFSEFHISSGDVFSNAATCRRRGESSARGRGKARERILPVVYSCNTR